MLSILIMKQLPSYQLVFIFLILVSCSPKINLEEEEKAVRSTLEGYVEAWSAKDISGFEEIFMNDETLTIYENRHIFLGWDAWKERLEDAFPSVEKVDVLFSSTIVHVAADGKAAWINTIEDASWLDDGEVKRANDMRVSWGLSKVGEEWKIVQAHWSVP